MELLVGFARGQGIGGARFQGIGAFTDAELGFLDYERKDYDRFPVEEETEVLALLGNLSSTDQGPWVHAHVTLGRRDGSTVGGHLFEGHVGATLELFVTVLPASIHRSPDEATGLPLLDL
jgi:uncharacterized protein